MSNAAMRRVIQSEAGRRALICGLLLLLTWIVFGQTVRHGFVNYDDPSYVLLQPEINRGLTLHGIRWAFTNTHSGNWHPLTSMSHMLDCSLFGLEPGGHHFMNVALHGLAALSLFVVLSSMTAASWRSAFVAMIFAIHPLRVESVAWIAERKDVLSGLFFILTLAAYVRYARRPSLIRYLATAALFTLGLLAKPMLVTLPFVLVLIDFWPLRRQTTLRTQIVEKLPLLVLSAGVCVATVLAQRATINSLDNLPLAWRLENAVVAIFKYVAQMFWPLDLAVFYPHPRGTISPLLAVTAAVALGAITGFAVILRKRAPYFAVGWLWYLGMLVPVLGILQVGIQAHADRYTYLPQIGLYLLLTWGAADVLQRVNYRRVLLASAVAVITGALAVLAHAQVKHWRSSETLWRHTLAVAPNNAVAHTNLGNLLPAREAIAEYEKAIAADPESAEALNNLAWELAACPEASLRDGKRGVDLATRAVNRFGGNDPVTLRTLAAALAEAGRFSEAIQIAELALPLAVAQRNDALANDLRSNIADYSVRIPVRDASLLEAAEP